MSETAPNGTEPSDKGHGTEKQETSPNLGDIIGDIEHFCRLSSDLKDCLSGITRKIIVSLNELKSVQQAVAQIKTELKNLYDMEASAAALKDLKEKHRLKQAEFETVKESQRRHWEEEKALKEREEEEYLQALKLRRRREEEDYKQKLAQEQSILRQKMEEELQEIRQQNMEKQEMLKRDLIKREQALKGKELEWIRLIQELELFMTRLVEKTRRKNAVGEVAAMDRKGNSSLVPKNAASDAPSTFVKDSEGEGKTEIAEELDNPAEPSVASIREMLLSQERRIENIHGNLENNREPLPFKVLPKDNI